MVYRVGGQRRSPAECIHPVLARIGQAEAILPLRRDPLHVPAYARSHGLPHVLEASSRDSGSATHPEVWHQFDGRQAGIVLLQPESRDTAARLLLPLIYILLRDPGVSVEVYPSNYFICSEDRLFLRWNRRRWEVSCSGEDLFCRPQGRISFSSGRGQAIRTIPRRSSGRPKPALGPLASGRPISSSRRRCTG